MSEKITKVYSLNNGRSMPAIGFGTWMLHGEETIKTMIEAALEEGYRHFDLAHAYNNEKIIGCVFTELINKGSTKREELFITSKIWNTYHDDVELAINTTLNNLNMSYLDLYLVHWPVSAKPDHNYSEIKTDDNKIVLNPFNLEKLWKDMEKLVESGKTRSIGICNFGIKNMTKLLSFCKIKPVCLQVEMHPFFKQKELLAFCNGNEILMEAYSSLKCIADISDIKGKAIIDIAQKHNCSVPSVIINYLICKNVSVINKTSKPERLKDNMKKINLSEDDLAQIDEIKDGRRYVDPVWFGEGRFD